LCKYNGADQLLSFGGNWQKDNGAFAEYVRFNAAVCWKLPDGMTYEEAASFPVCPVDHSGSN